MKTKSLLASSGFVCSIFLQGAFVAPAHATDAINSVPVQQVARSIVINNSCQEIWKTISDFGGIARWYSGFSKSRHMSGPVNQVGAVRELTRASNGKTFEEKMILFDRPGFTMAYSHVKAGPVRETINQVRLESLNSRQQCLATWGSTFRLKPEQENDAEKIKGFFVKAFNNVLADLKTTSEQ